MTGRETLLQFAAWLTARPDAGEPVAWSAEDAEELVDEFLAQREPEGLTLNREECADLARLLGWVPAVESDGPNSWTRAQAFKRRLVAGSRGEA